MKIGIIFGTRPEAIKMAPLYKKLIENNIDTKIISTGQHKEMLDQVLNVFEIIPDYNLNIMKKGQSLCELTSRLLNELDKILKKERFDLILVHGDTSTTMTASLAGFYNKIPIGHVEAGLRTKDIYDPYPEELNRRITSNIANYHFAPTELAKQNLIKENIPEKNIIITGNTVIDSIKWIKENKSENIKMIQNNLNLKKQKYILMTMHRRENWGTPIENVMKAVKKYTSEKNIKVIFPIHLNPIVRENVKKIIKNDTNIILTEPLEYLEFISLMDGCHYIMTDSGGIQEEAQYLKKTILILRKTTERPEAIKNGTAILVGTEEDKVYNAMKELEKNMYKNIIKDKNPFGDGFASEKIVDFILKSKQK
jgi:UDP-N-acetylglucosamine 2-epimerase (non-hydrolysing)